MSFARGMDVHTSGLVDGRTDSQSRFMAQKVLFFFGPWGIAAARDKRTQFMRSLF
jgi:hypothetical protein